MKNKFSILLAMILVLSAMLPAFAQRNNDGRRDRDPSPSRGTSDHRPSSSRGVSDRRDQPRQNPPAQAPAPTTVRLPTSTAPPVPVYPRDRFDVHPNRDIRRFEHQDFDRRPDNRVVFTFGFGYPYYPYYPYYYPRDYVEVRTVPYVYVPSAASQYEALGGQWGIGLRNGSYSWQQFVAYMRAYIVPAPSDLSGYFRAGFVNAYGGNGYEVFDYAVSQALGHAAPRENRPPPPPSGY